MNKRYFVVKNATGAGDAVEFANGTKTDQNGTNSYTLYKLADSKSILPTGETVIEYDTREEAAVAAVSVVFNDYSTMNDEAFVQAYAPFTTNDKDQGRRIRQAISAWTAKNATAWPPSYHSSIWDYYDPVNQRLSDGALTPAYLVLLQIPNIINDPVSGDNVDMSSLNSLLISLLSQVFAKFPR